MQQFYFNASETAIQTDQLQSFAQDFKLPDDQVINIEKNAQLLPELYFNTTLLNLFAQPNQGVNTLQFQIFGALQNLPEAITREQLQNLVISGGGSKIKNI